LSGCLTGAASNRELDGFGSRLWCTAGTRWAGRLEEALEAIALEADLGRALGEIDTTLVAQPRLEPARREVLAGDLGHRAAGGQELVNRGSRTIGGGEVVRSVHRPEYRRVTRNLDHPPLESEPCGR